MGLFSRRFKETQSPGMSVPDGRIRWVTNGPPHWPAIETEPLPFPRPANIVEHGQDLWMLAAAMKETFQAAGDACRLSAIFQNRLSPEGLLIIWLEVTDRGGVERLKIFGRSSRNTHRPRSDAPSKSPSRWMKC
jgi:hypothetical protein